jgi:hypothetical protein
MGKIKRMLDIKLFVNKKHKTIFLGHIEYYRKFIQHYVDIKFPIRHYVEFQWSQECNNSFELLKRKLLEAPILRFPDWSTKFHVLVDACNVFINEILSHTYDYMVDNTNTYVKFKVNKLEKNYLATKREALEMIFSLKKIQTLSLSKFVCIFH